MKQKDIVLIVVVAFFAGIFSLIISNVVFGSNKHGLTTQVVDEISPDFPTTPNNRIFNAKAINPTKLIRIGDTKNSQPFTDKTSSQ